MPDGNRESLDALFRADPFAAALGAEILDWGDGRARVRYTPGRTHVNFLGGVHGGALYAAADVALSVASNSWGRRCVAISIEAHYLAPATPGDVLVVHAEEEARSRRIGSYRLHVEDATGRLVASLHALGFRTDGWHLGEDAWPEDWRRAY
jgi:acyl-CoA thioesterase